MTGHAEDFCMNSALTGAALACERRPRRAGFLTIGAEHEH